jgi:hypothetical protein
MPYCFGEDDPGWGERPDDAPLDPALFRYLPPPDLGGAPEPVTFDSEPPAPAAPLSVPPPPQPAPRPSLLDRLLGRSARAPAAPMPSYADREREQARMSQLWLSVVVPALSTAGVRSVYCRYDGGNDEGFAWLDHATTDTGERLDPAMLAKRLADTDLVARLEAAGLIGSYALGEPAGEVEGIARDGIAIDFAVRLLGNGFGTGPYWLYGAFTADLAAGTITDDRRAEPVAENIALQR